MHTGLLGSVVFFLFFLALLGLRRWAYVCLCALTEVCWVFLVYMYGLVAVETNDGGVLFWGLANLAYSAVELCLCLYTFILVTDLQGTVHG